MTATAVNSVGSGLIDDYIKKSQAATDAAKQQMAANVANGLNSTTTSTLSGNFNTFLKILTTQLKNQDPTAPMDTNQFTQELVEFSGVEQQLNTNKLLQQLVTASGASGVKSLLGFVGQYVEVPANDHVLIQDKQAAFAYTLSGESKNVTITVKDSTGKTVATFAGPTSNGTNNIVWNGEDSDGNQLADGAYSLAIAASDTAGNAITVSDMQIIGKVTGVQTADSFGNDLQIGPNMLVKDSDVSAIFSPGSIPQASQPSS